MSVSVVVPAYNRSQALRATLDSVRAQTYPDWELIVVDDGSVDDTGDVVRSYRDSRIRYEHQANQGQAAARNYGLSLATGEYVAFLDHDDRWLPEKLRLQVESLDSGPEYGLVYGRCRLIDEDGGDLGGRQMFEGSGWLYTHLLREHNFLLTMSQPMMRTGLVREVGGFDSDADLSDDLDLFLRLARITQFGFIPAELIEKNIGNRKQQTGDIVRVFLSERRLLAKHLRIPPRLTRTELAAVRQGWLNIYYPEFKLRALLAHREGKYELAWTYYQRMIELFPASLLEPVVLRDLASLAKQRLFGRKGYSDRPTGE